MVNPVLNQSLNVTHTSRITLRGNLPIFTHCSGSSHIEIQISQEFTTGPRQFYLVHTPGANGARPALMNILTWYLELKL